jgi:flagellar operon protein
MEVIMKIQNSPFLSNLQVQEQYLNQKKVPLSNQTNSQGLSFQDILAEKAQKSNQVSELKFSKHASNRLAERNIQLTNEQMERLKEGTGKAGEKGIQESLVLMDQLAFIVNVPSNTVITAMDQSETSTNIFTNIDGAVII